MREFLEKDKASKRVLQAAKFKNCQRARKSGSSNRRHRLPPTTSISRLRRKNDKRSVKNLCRSSVKNLCRSIKK